MRSAGTRTAGGYALARLGKSQVQIANEVGVSKVTVHQWISGDKRPGKPARGRITNLYGIAGELFDEDHAPNSKAPSPPPSAPAIRVTDDADAAGGAFAMARALQRQAQAQLDELEMDGDDWTKAEKALVTQRLASTVNVLAKLTGQYELGRRMLSLPIWKVLERELYDVLQRFPEAAEAVSERLDNFERKWMGSR